MNLEIEKIIVKERIRQNVGSLELLTESIKKVGLLNPIIVDENNELISGFRRLEACKKLGWNEIEVQVVSLDSDEEKALKIELEENKGRLDLSLQDMDKYKEKMEEILTPPLQPNPIVAFFIKIWSAIKNLFKKSVADEAEQNTTETLG